MQVKFCRPARALFFTQFSFNFPVFSSSVIVTMVTETFTTAPQNDDFSLYEGFVVRQSHYTILSCEFKMKGSLIDRQGQGRSQPHGPGWERVPLSSLFPQISINFPYCFLKHFSFPSSFWPSRWASLPPLKALALATPLDGVPLV